MTKIKKLKYCFIDINYLKKIFNSQTIIDRKYDKRPYVYFAKFNIAIAFPEVTNHKKFKYWDNLYFDNMKHYLNVSSLIYVPEKYVISNFEWNNKPDNLKKLSEINSKLNELEKILGKVMGYIENNSQFRSKHKFIFKSKKLCQEELEKEKEQSKGPELSM